MQPLIVTGRTQYKSLSTILTKHLTDHGQMWPKYLSLATPACTTFNSPNLGNYIPHELVFGRKLKLLSDLETNTDTQGLLHITQ